LIEQLRSIAAGMDGELRIVDLGCGDAWLVSEAFRDAPPASYLAVDLSESAVERARKHVAPWGPRASVSCGDLAAFVASLPDQSANFVLASNSLHHFGSDGKAKILQQCFRVLSPGGVFCWIDPIREEGESRDDYLRRLTAIMMNEWTGLTEEQRRRGTQHVLESDFPESESWMRDACAAAGFQFGGRFLEHELFGAWKFVKA
jgi:ubiquinone/menaquinone biosynthesis C-methylase UbiE